MEWRHFHPAALSWMPWHNHHGFQVLFWPTPLLSVNHHLFTHILATVDRTSTELRIDPHIRNLRRIRRDHTGRALQLQLLHTKNLQANTLLSTKARFQSRPANPHLHHDFEISEPV